MGFSISWIAVRGKPKDDVLAQLSLVDTGTPDDMNESPVSGAQLPGGVTLLFLNDVEHPFIQDEMLAPLSAGCDVLACQVEEHVMVSASFLFTNGVKVWQVAHLSEHGKYHLAVEGHPPEIFAHIRSEMQAAQDEEGGEDADVNCLFEAPLMLAMSYVGYRHDQVALVTGEEVSFTELVPR